MTSVRRGILLAVLLFPTLMGFADDLSVFGAANRGMGGAGLAIMRNPASQVFLNPAAIAYVHRFRLGLGGFNLRTEGATLNRLMDALNFRQGALVDLEEGARLAREFGREETTLFLTGDFSLSFPGLSIGAGVLAEARFIPSEDLRRWANESGDPNRLGSSTYPNPRGDLIGIATVSVPEVTAGVRLPFRKGELAVGARLRLLKVFYFHYYADKINLPQGQSAFRASEMGGRDYLDKEGTAIDFGLLFRPQQKSRLTFALVVENLVEPDVEFEGIDNSNLPGVPVDLKPLKRALHLGSALELSTGTLVALDLIDLGNNTGRGELRVGVEQRIGRAVALRTGYASRTGFTAGVDLWGLNVAYARRLPIQVSRNFAF